MLGNKYIKTQISSSSLSSSVSVAIGVSSWRDGQKLVKRMLGPLPREPCSQSEERERQTGVCEQG